MEIIAAIIIYALGEEIKSNHREINALSDELIILQGAHSSLYARTRLDHDTHHAKIDNNMEAIEDLQQQLNSLSE